MDGCIDDYVAEYFDPLEGTDRMHRLVGGTRAPFVSRLSSPTVWVSSPAAQVLRSARQLWARQGNVLPPCPHLSYRAIKALQGLLMYSEGGPLVAN
ncbi:hypothetical protein E2C01_087266 [Portunus trituberculatus]|uniref:Uncharacterized protein n=1 Tax=Portunus trituberculatus TaxID=210409 RepID=A0A5B7J7N9_PORTR|nr:hypothetical protein [Portunus trituberculatus]